MNYIDRNSMQLDQLVKLKSAADAITDYAAARLQGLERSLNLSGQECKDYPERTEGTC